MIERAFRARKRILRIRGVLGCAVGFRTRAGKRVDEPALIVYVKKGRKGVNYRRLARHFRIPRAVRVRLNKHVETIPTDIVESTLGTLHNGSGVIQAGLSIGNRRAADNTGTIGWIARRRDDGSPVVCSAFHALLRLGKSQLEGNRALVYTFDGEDFEDVVSPSLEDGGDPLGNMIGHVLAGRRDATTDVAIACVTDDSRVRSAIKFLGQIGPVRFVTSADVDLERPAVLSMTGRTSGRIAGELTAYPAAHAFEYPDHPDGLLLDDLIETDLPTQGGDSGALLVDAANRPLGMLVGAAEGRAYFIHIRNVATAMNLKDW